MKGEGKILADFTLFFIAGSAAVILSSHGAATPAMRPGSPLLYIMAALSMSGGCLAALYGRFLKAAFFCAGIFSASVYLLAGDAALEAPGSGTWFLPRAAEASSVRLKSLIAGMPFDHQESNAMVLALITGDRSMLPHSVSESFTDSGAAHILALSGMHLGIIYVILSRLFSVLGKSVSATRAKSVLTVCISGFYTLMTGAGASIMRAFLFILLNEAAKCSGRSRPPMNVFCAALIIQAAFSPGVLESAGFQLSYLAMAGLYILYPKMKSWYSSRHPEGGFHPVKALWDMAAMSISCQIFTAPAVWFHFGTFPQYFLITNLIAIPLSTLTMNISVLAITLHSLGICPPLLLQAGDAAIMVMCRSLEIISGL